MIRPAHVRAIRAYTGENQQQFGQRFGVTRYTVNHWEQYGIVDQPDLERRILQLDEPHHDRQPSDERQQSPK